MADEVVRKPIDPADPLIAAFMRKSNVLIVDQSSSSRPTIRRLMSSLGAKVSSVDIAETFDFALEKIAATKPTIMFSDYELGKGTALDIFQAFNKASPSRLQTIFIVLATDNSASTAAAIAEGDVDGVIIRPMTYNDLQDKFLEVLITKIVPSEYMKMLEAGRRFNEVGKTEAALQALQKAQTLDLKPAMAFCQEGMIRKQTGDIEGAQNCFEQALKINSQHFRSLVALFDMYMEQKLLTKAYEIGLLMCSNYPINPRRIPELIRLCVAHENFTEVLRFHEIVSKMDNADESLSRFISVGLVICGKFLLKKSDKEEAIKTFRKAELSAKGRAGVIKEIIICLYASGCIPEAEDFLKRASKEVSSSDDVLLAILEQMHVQGPHSKTFLLAQEMTNKGASSPKLYEIYIRQAKGMRRPETVIQEIVWKACSAYPEQKEFFEGLSKG
jgi:tetratricopeptide (TPR) repeat protein